MRKRRKITNLCLALAGIALGIVAQRYFASYNLSDGLILYAAAAFLFVYAFRKYKAPTRWMAQKRVRMESRPYRRWAWLPLALAILASLYSLRLFDRETHLGWAWILYLASISLFITAVYLLDGQPLRRLDAMPLKRSLLPVACLLLILLVAAFVRAYKIGSLPYGLWYDEAAYGMTALRILNESAYRPIYDPSTHHPAFFHYLIAASFSIFGVSVSSLRLVSILFGIATVGAFYFLMKLWFGEKIALAGAFLLALSRWHINFSRIVLIGIATPLFEILALYFFFKGLRSRRPLHYALSGISMGLGLWFFTAYRLFPLVIFLFLLHISFTRREFIRKNWFGLVLFIIAVWLVIAPMAQYALQHSDKFWGRTKHTSIFRGKSTAQTIKDVLQSARKHLLMFNYRGDRNGRHNLQGEPMLDFCSSVLAVLGFGYALSRWRDPRYLLLVYWLLIMLSAGIFSLAFEAPQAYRAIGALPVAYILACVPLEPLARGWSRITRASRLLLTACCCLLLYIGWSNYYTYFNKQARDFAVWNAFSTAETRLAYEIERLKDDYGLYFAPVLNNQLTTRFLAPDFKDYRPFDPATIFPLHGPTQKGVAMFIHPHNHAVRMLAEWYYPGVEIEEFKHPYGGPTVLYTYLFDKEDIESVQGLPGTYSHNGEVVRRRDKRVDFDWQEEAPLPFPFDIQWEGALLAPAHGAYTLDLVGEGQLWLDGRLLDDGEVLLAEGLHALRIRCRVEEPGETRLLWQMPEEEALTTVPGDAFYAPPVTANGLLAEYFPNDSWQDPPAFARIEPLVSWYFHFIPLPRPYTVEWKGYIDILTDGRYRLGTECLSASWLYVDGKLLVENTQPNNYLEKPIYLEEGLHRVDLRLLDADDHSHIYFYWTPPGGRQEIVPMERLFPLTP